MGRGMEDPRAPEGSSLRVTEEPSGSPSCISSLSAFHVGNIIADFSVSSPASTGAQVAPGTSSMGLLGPGLWAGAGGRLRASGAETGQGVSLLWASLVLSEPARAGQDAARAGPGDTRLAGAPRSAPGCQEGLLS